VSPRRNASVLFVIRRHWGVTGLHELM
jgi:hypothetical protein